MFFFYRNTNRYRPYIDYNWSTTIDSITGDRLLKDVGHTPKYNATLYSGREVKFNGTDQSIIAGAVSSLGLTESPTEFTIGCEFNGNNGKILNIGSDSTSHGITIQQTNGELKLNANHNENEILKCGFYDRGTTVITFKNNKFSIYCNGELIISKTFVYSNTFNFLQTDELMIGSYNDGNSLYDGLVGNIFIVNDVALTPTEIKYQYSHPEKFLYHEKQSDGTFIAKSEILSQDKIDNVVAHFPMCETDGYVRNMIGYSEASPIIDTGGTYISDDDEVATHDYADGVHTIEVTTAGTNHVRPYIQINISDTLEVGSTYLYSFDIKVISGTFGDYTFHLNNGAEGTKLYSGSDLSVYDVAIAGYAQSELAFIFDGRNTFKIEISNIKAKKLTETYPIENFTNAARDNAKNLTIGLQTCFWKRDVLGVPIGSSFDEIICDGVGYADTEFTPDPLKSFQIEIIVAFGGDGVETVIGLVDGTNHIYFRRNNNINRTEYKINDKQVYPNASDPFIKNHYVLEYNSVLATITAYLNGAKHSDNTSVSFSSPSNPFSLAKRNDGATQNFERLNGLLHMLKVHTTPQDPAQLYADAVKKGLLS